MDIAEIMITNAFKQAWSKADADWEREIDKCTAKMTRAATVAVRDEYMELQNGKTKAFNNMVAVCGVDSSVYGQKTAEWKDILSGMAKGLAANIYTDVFDNVAGTWQSVKVGPYYIREHDGSYEVYYQSGVDQRTGKPEYDILQGHLSKKELINWVRQLEGDGQGRIPAKEGEEFIANIDSINERTRFAEQARLQLTNLHMGATSDDILNMLMQNQGPGRDKAIEQLKTSGVDDLQVKNFYCVDPTSGADYPVSIVGGYSKKEGQYVYVDLYTGRKYTGKTKQDVWNMFLKKNTFLPADTIIAYQNEKGTIVQTDIKNEGWRVARTGVATATMLVGGVLCLIPTGTTQVIGGALLSASAAINFCSLMERCMSGEAITPREWSDNIMAMVLVFAFAAKGAAAISKELREFAGKAAQILGNAGGKYFIGAVAYDTLKTIMENDPETAKLVFQNLMYIAFQYMLTHGGKLSAKQMKEYGIRSLDDVKAKIKQTEGKIQERIKKYSSTDKTKATKKSTDTSTTDDTATAKNAKTQYKNAPKNGTKETVQDKTGQKTAKGTTEKNEQTDSDTSLDVALENAAASQLGKGGPKLAPGDDKFGASIVTARDDMYADKKRKEAGGWAVELTPDNSNILSASHDKKTGTTDQGITPEEKKRFNDLLANKMQSQKKNKPA